MEKKGNKELVPWNKYAPTKGNKIEGCSDAALLFLTISQGTGEQGRAKRQQAGAAAGSRWRKGGSVPCRQAGASTPLQPFPWPFPCCKAHCSVPFRCSRKAVSATLVAASGHAPPCRFHSTALHKEPCSTTTATPRASAPSLAPLCRHCSPPPLRHLRPSALPAFCLFALPCRHRSHLYIYAFRCVKIFTFVHRPTGHYIRRVARM